MSSSAVRGSGLSRQFTAQKFECSLPGERSGLGIEARPLVTGEPVTRLVFVENAVWIGGLDLLHVRQRDALVLRSEVVHHLAAWLLVQVVGDFSVIHNGAGDRQFARRNV